MTLTEYLLSQANEIADKRKDGHLTIMKFTTNWRVGLGTMTSREDIQQMFVGETLDKALFNFVNLYQNIGK